MTTWLMIMMLACLTYTLKGGQKEFAYHKDCSGHKNEMPLLTGTMTHIGSVQNGDKYILSDGKGDSNKIIIAKIKGNPYECGLALGQMLKKEVKFTSTCLYDYAWKFVSKFIQFLPNFILETIKTVLLTFIREMLNISFILRKNNIPSRFLDEIRGMADGAELDYMDLIRMNMIPEMLKAFCTLISIYPPAAKGGKALLMRALDWDPHAPIHRYSTITVYHPDEGFPFANIGYAGLIGSLGAMSSTGVGIGEQLWGAKDGAKMSITGEPWHFVLRDVAQFARNMDEAKKILIEAKRTCFIHLMLSSSAGSERTGLGVFYSYNVLIFYDDKNYTSKETFPGTITFPYHNNHCIETVLREHKNGGVDPEVLFRETTPLIKSGDSINAVMDLTDMKLYVAFAGYPDSTPAYERSHFKIDMKALFE